MQRARGFTLIEIALGIFILLLLLMLAIPSFTGVIANRRLKQSLDDFNNLVHRAQELSVAERRPYLIAWDKNDVIVRPEAFAELQIRRTRIDERKIEIDGDGSSIRSDLPGKPRGNRAIAATNFQRPCA